MKLFEAILTGALLLADLYNPVPADVPKAESDLLQYAQSKMKINDYVDMLRAIEVGSKYFPHIEPEIVLSVFYIESHFDKYALNTNTNETEDYGLSQQNSKYYKDRFKTAKIILDKEKLFRSDWNNPYDIYLNVLACYIHLDWCFKQKQSKTEGIKKYNGMGIQTEIYLKKFLDVYYFMAV